MSEAYPLLTYRFEVNWGGTQIGFTEVSGLDFETEAAEYRHGASPESSGVKKAGRRKWSNITLKRGTFAHDNEYYEWWNAVQSLDGARRDVTIKLLNEESDPVAVWKVRNAWPTKVQSTGLKADGSEVAIESMEIVHEGLSMQND